MRSNRVGGRGSIVLVAGLLLAGVVSASPPNTAGFAEASGSAPSSGDDETVVEPSPGTSTVTSQQSESQAVEQVMDFLADPTDSLGLAESDTSELELSSVVSSSTNGLTHVYVQQQHNGLDIVGAIVNVAVDKNGAILSAASRLVTIGVTDDTTEVTSLEAAASAAAAIGAEPTSPISVLRGPSGDDQAQTLSNGGVSADDIPARLVYEQIDDKTLRLAWEITIRTVDGQDWWQIRIDATTGDEISRYNFVVHDDFGPSPSHEQGSIAHGSVPSVDPVDAVDGPSADALVAPSFVGVDDGSSYVVYPQPVEAPSFGARATVENPADPAASPFGWHDTDGAVGAESTQTIGNNVSAYLDRDGTPDVPDAGSQPNDPDLVFNFYLNLDNSPTTYQPAAVTNLFYWTNIAHDYLYAYGFDESAGNFQTNNYGNGGAGGDAVLAEAQDGSGTANANFATPPDGSPGRMQMFLWPDATPARDGDLDASVVTHEYAHGLSTRLTGGPGASCLSNGENAGEGWSDYVALMMTMRETDTATTQRGIGTYVLNQPTTGPGIRDFRYTTRMTGAAGTFDPRTYDAIKTASGTHAVGSTFTAMLWEVTWALIGRYGFDTDLARGDGGNNVAMQLVVDGLKLQPCSPGFVDSRDAILLADQVNNGGENTCLIWGAFAKRGLGFSADQGAPDSTVDGTEAFDLPPSCPLGVTKSVDPPVAEAGGELTYSLTVRNSDSPAQTGVVVTDVLPTGTTYVNGSAQCGGTLSGRTISFDIGTLAPLASRTCSFRVLTSPTAFSQVGVPDGFEPNAAAWTRSSPSGGVNWELRADPAPPAPPRSHSAPNAMFAAEPATVSEKLLTTAAPVAIGENASLSFWHRYTTEPGFDGGVVEISVDGGTIWTDLGPHMTQNGYDAVLSTGFSNPLAGRSAFTGLNDEYRQTIVDLSDFEGENVLIRFRFGSDGSIAGSGWFVDDVSFDEVVTVKNTASVSSSTHSSSSDAVATTIVAPTLPAAPTAVTGVAGNARVAVAWSRPALAPGDSAITSFTATSTPGGKTCTTTGATSCTVTGLTNGTAYRFRVTARNAAGNSPASAPSAPLTPVAPPPPPTPSPGPGPLESAIWEPVVPARLWDTREAPAGATVDDVGVGGGKVAAGSITRIQIAGRGGVARDARGAIVNVTAIQPESLGYFTVFPCSATPPNASSLNFSAADNLGNEIAAALDADGEICVFSSVVAHLAIDAVGYLSADSPYGVVDPVRLLDTRPSGATIDGQAQGGGLVAADSQIAVQIGGRGNVPTDATAAVVNITAIQPSAVGYITAHGCVTPLPLSSSLNYTPGTNRGNEVVVQLNDEGKLCLYTAVATNLAVDVVGYLAPGSGVSATTPSRLLDTRPNGETIDGQFQQAGVPPAGTVTVLQVSGRAGVPAGATTVLVNVTAVQASGVGYVTVFPCSAQPNASSLNFRAGVNGGNELIAGLSETGTLCLFNSADTHLTVDITGFTS